MSRASYLYVSERHARGEFAATTVLTVRSILNRFVAAVDDPPVENLSRRCVRRWWGTLAVGPSCARNQLQTVRTFLGWCVDRELLRDDPSRGIRPPREPRRLPRTLNVEQVAQTVERGCPDARARAIVLLEVQSGLRACEISRAQVGDISHTDRTLFVRGKGSNERVVYIPDEAWQALGRYLCEYPASSGPLFRRYDQPHRGLVPHYVSDMVRKWMRDAGVKQAANDGVSGHGLRRTCASDMLDNGAVPTDVQTVLGHANLATLNPYLRRRSGTALRSAMEGRSYLR